VEYALIVQGARLLMSALSSFSTKVGEKSAERVFARLSPDERGQVGRLAQADPVAAEKHLTAVLAEQLRRDDTLEKLLRETLLEYNPMANQDTVDRVWADIPLPVYKRTADRLDAGGMTELPAVDDCVLLYEFRDGDVGLDGLLRAESSHRRAVAESVLHPNGRQLRSAVRRSGTEESVADYLTYHATRYLQRMKREERSKFPDYNKIGVRSFTWPNSWASGDAAPNHPARPFTLQVAPTLYWIEQEFNRRILTDQGLDARLRELYQTRLSDVLQIRQGDTTPNLAPSTLYVEVATLTADGKMILAEKTIEGGSQYALIGRPLTCPLERSLKWQLFGRGYIDLMSGLAVGVRKELGLDPEKHIGNVSWIGIALEGNLNISVLGIMNLTLRSGSKELKKLQEIDYRKGRYRFVDLKDLPEEVFAKAKDGRWHTTARMRALMALRKNYKHEKLAERLVAAREYGSEGDGV
jgi:hypothetical protein